MGQIIDPNDDGRPKPGEMPNFNPTTKRDELMGITVICKRWLDVKAIMAETGFPTGILIEALRRGHGIKIAYRRDADPNSFIDNPALYFVYSEEAKNLMHKHGVENPTFAQIFSTCEVVDSDKERAVQRFRELKGDPRGFDS